MIWPIDDPYGGETGWPHRSELGDGHDEGCEAPDCEGECTRLDDIERAELDAATRADMWIDEGTDFDGPEWPF